MSGRRKKKGTMSGRGIRTCRVCRKRSAEHPRLAFISLNFRGADVASESLAGMFTFVTGIPVSAHSDHMPRDICTYCMQQLRACYKFRKLCMESDQILRNAPPEEEKPSSSRGSGGGDELAVSSLDKYDESFYQIVQDKLCYMELNFVALRCCGCREAFASEEQLQQHSRDVHRKGQLKLEPHQCSICFATFSYEAALELHQSTALENLFCCRFCRRIFETKLVLFGHLRVQHQRQECDLERSMDNTSPVQQEFAMGHSIFDAEPTPSRGPFLQVAQVQSLAGLGWSDTFNLGYCELTPELTMNQLHPSQYKVVEQTETFSIIEFTWHRCCACTHMFATKTDLDIHCTEEHRKQYVPHDSSYGVLKPFMCEQCWRRFKKKSLLGLHQKFNRKKIYSCNQCLHVFLGGPAFEKHLPGCRTGGEDTNQLQQPHPLWAEQFVTGDQQGGDDGGETSYNDGQIMLVDVKEEQDDDDDVYILND